jgi:hypothetical protein
MNITFVPDTAIEAISNGWKTAKEIYTDAGVKKLTWDNFKKSLSMIDHTQSFNRSNRNGGPLFSPEIEKQFQMWLMRNQTNQGRSSKLVKETTTISVGNDIALKEIINSGNVEAMQCLMEHYVNETRAVGEAKRLEQINNQLRLENKQKDSTIVQLTNENDYLKKANDFTTAQLGLYRKKYHSYYDDYEIY